MALPPIAPMPPRFSGWIPWIGGGVGLLRDPTAFFATARRRLGDTFVVDAFGQRFFCVFSAAGVRALYALPEAEASKGLADVALLRLKVPDALLMGRRTRPHDLFGREDVEGYLGAVEHAVAEQLAELGANGTLDVFAFARRLGQRIGLSCWAGSEAASARTLDRILPLLDRLEASDAFVRPAHAFVTWATRKRREHEAVRGIEAILGEIVAARDRASSPHDDFLARIIATWSDTNGPTRVQGIARDVTMLHMGSQSNLPAALGWTIVDLVQRPTLAARIEAGDDTLLEQCANESIRMAQRSITLRAVRSPVTIDDGHTTYTLAPGVLVTTMLSVTNTTSAEGLDRFDPAHYDGRRLVAPPDLATRELVSTFGHGRHGCPAQRFSISAIRIATRRLLEQYTLTPSGSAPPYRRRQIGGVARAEHPYRVAYARR